MAEDINRYNFEKITYAVLDINILYVGINMGILTGYQTNGELTRPKIALTMAAVPIQRRLPQVIVTI